MSRVSRDGVFDHRFPYLYRLFLSNFELMSLIWFLLQSLLSVFSLHIISLSSSLLSVLCGVFCAVLLCCCVSSCVVVWLWLFLKTVDETHVHGLLFLLRFCPFFFACVWCDGGGGCLYPCVRSNVPVCTSTTPACGGPLFLFFSMFFLCFSWACGCLPQASLCLRRGDGAGHHQLYHLHRQHHPHQQQHQLFVVHLILQSLLSLLLLKEKNLNP